MWYPTERLPPRAPLRTRRTGRPLRLAASCAEASADAPPVRSGRPVATEEPPPWRHPALRERPAPPGFVRALPRVLLPPPPAPRRTRRGNTMLARNSGPRSRPVTRKDRPARDLPVNAAPNAPAKAMADEGAASARVGRNRAREMPGTDCRGSTTSGQAAKASPVPSSTPSSRGLRAADDVRPGEGTMEAGLPRPVLSRRPVHRVHLCGHPWKALPTRAKRGGVRCGSPARFRGRRSGERRGKSRCETSLRPTPCQGSRQGPNPSARRATFASASRNSPNPMVFQAESGGHPPRPAGEARATGPFGSVISTERERSHGTRWISPSSRNDPHRGQVPRKQGDFPLRWK